MPRRLFFAALLLVLLGCQATVVPTSIAVVNGTDTPVALTVEPVDTPMPVPTATSVNTFIPSPTITPVPSPLPKPSPTVTRTRAPAPTFSPVVPTPTGAGVNCPVLPVGGFLTIWNNNPDLRALLDCPSSHHPRIQPDAWAVLTAYEPFEHGAMLWSNQQGWYTQPIIYVLYSDMTYASFQDTFQAGVDPINGGTPAPAGLVEPSMGFGKLWRTEAAVRAALGWATAPEQDGDGRYEMFLQGNMIWLAQTGKTYVLISGTDRSLYRILNVGFTTP
ncbi:MAG: hypothetical protein WCF84_22250 [Anaerolineae bacterium]